MKYFLYLRKKPDVYWSNSNGYRCNSNVFLSAVFCDTQDEADYVQLVRGIDFYAIGEITNKELFERRLRDK